MKNMEYGCKQRRRGHLLLLAAGYTKFDIHCVRKVPIEDDKITVL